MLRAMDQSCSNLDQSEISCTWRGPSPKVDHTALRRTSPAAIRPPLDSSIHPHALRVDGPVLRGRAVRATGAAMWRMHHGAQAQLVVQTEPVAPPPGLGTARLAGRGGRSAFVASGGIARPAAYPVVLGPPIALSTPQARSDTDGGRPPEPSAAGSRAPPPPRDVQVSAKGQLGMDLSPLVMSRRRLNTEASSRRPEWAYWLVTQTRQRSPSLRATSSENWRST